MWVFLKEEGIRKGEKKLNELLFDKAAAVCPREFHSGTRLRSFIVSTSKRRMYNIIKHAINQSPEYIVHD